MQVPPTPTPYASQNNSEVIQLADTLTDGFDLWTVAPTAIQYWGSLGVATVIFQMLVLITIVGSGVALQVNRLSRVDDNNAP